MSDIVERLTKAIEAYGDAPDASPIVEDGSDSTCRVTDVLAEAIVWIERARFATGKAEIGKSFSEMVKNVPRRGSEGILEVVRSFGPLSDDDALPEI